MTKKKKKVTVKKEEPAVYFENVLDAILNVVRQKIGGFRLRSGGAQEYGPEGMFICANETLSSARNDRDYNQYILSAAYSISAAMQILKQWNINLLPAPEPKKEEVS
ncbi:MAG TPA: hypothetical protein ENI23_04030 [bacterium]|nr:hypothetical protein [bacterium]